MAVRRVDDFWIGGALAGHAEANGFAAEVMALLHRYATEVVAAHRLCPFLHNVENGLGAVCVILDRDMDVAEAVGAIQATGSSVVHVVYPVLARSTVDPSSSPALSSSSRFERFGNSVAEGLRRIRSETLVHATFHPDLVGGTENPHRMVGLLRRAPDPFIQFIPPGMHEGGTVIAGAEAPSTSPLEATFARVVTGGGLSELDRLMSELHAQRKTRDQRFADAFFSG